MGRIRHIKTGDTVVALSGSSKGKTGKVLEVKPSRGVIRVEGLGIAKRHTKASQTSPKGGIVEKNRWLPASIFQASSEGGKKLGRVGFEIDKAGKKTRTYSGARAKK